MITYKIADLPVGSAMRSVLLSANKLHKLEELVFEALKSSLPKDTILIDIDVDVKLRVKMEPGGPIPIDVEMFTYHVKMPIEKRDEK